MGDERVGESTERVLICECRHPQGIHDSGGCCRENFCPCSEFREFRPITQRIPIGEPAKYNPLADFPIETSSYADLARWAYKARDFIRAAGSKA